MNKLFSVLFLSLLAASTSFIPVQTFKARSALKMNEECPEIPITAMMDPKYDTAIIALG